MRCLTRKASCAFRSSSSGFSKPRSAKTFPLPRVTVLDIAILLSFIRLIRCAVVRQGLLQPRFNKIKLAFWRLDPARGLLLKYMKNVDHGGKLQCIYGPECTPVMLRYDLEYTGSTEAGERLCGRMLAPDLCFV